MILQGMLFGPKIDPLASQPPFQGHFGTVLGGNKKQSTSDRPYGGHKIGKRCPRTRLRLHNGTKLVPTTARKHRAILEGFLPFCQIQDFMSFWLN